MIVNYYSTCQLQQLTIMMMMMTLMTQVQTVLSRKWRQCMQRRTVERQRQRSYNAGSVTNFDVTNVRTYTLPPSSLHAISVPRVDFRTKN